MLTYVYCLVRSRQRPSLRGVPPAIPGGRGIELLDAGRALWVVVTHVPDDEYDEAALARGLQQLDWVSRRALAHEAVVEHFLGAAAVLPMQLFTLFASDDRACAHVAASRRRIDRVLDRIDHQVEWGLRLSLDERTPPAAADGASRGRGAAAHAGNAESGIAYLSRKRDLVQAARTRLAQSRAAGNRLYRALARQATGAVRNPATERAAGSRVVVDAAFLVPRGRTAAFRAAVRREARVLVETGLVVALTGPWPPYNFVASRGRRS